MISGDVCSASKICIHLPDRLYSGDIKFKEMKSYTASRLSEGNKTFPIKILIDERGVTLKHPGVFSGQEKTIPFSRVSSVDTDCPLVGFSTISIQTTGEGKIEAHGFTKSEVTEMKEMILKNI